MSAEAVDAVVVGAGVAGLAAAEALAAEGLDVVVLEARNRLGGRVLTLPGLPPLEAGAEFLPRDGAAAGILADAGGVFAPAPDRHVRLVDGGATPVDFDAAMEALEAAGSRARRSTGDPTLAEALAAADVRGDAADLARRYVEQYHAAPAGVVSARWVAQVEATEEGGGGGAQVQSLDGLHRLVRLMAGALPAGAIRLATEAVAINAAGAGVRVVARGHAGESRLEAAHAIVTAPVALLAAGIPRLDPLPAAVGDALKRLRQGSVVKLALRFASAFWRDRLRIAGEGGGPPKFIHTGPPFPTWWTSAMLDAPTLVGWAGAGAAEALAGMGRDALLHAATAQLGALFGVPAAEVRARVVEVAFHDWVADPWSRGAYTYALPGGADVAERLWAGAASGPVLVAGEAFSGATGTVDGAVRSGRRAASRVLAARP